MSTKTSKIAEAAKPIEDAVAFGKETLESVVKASADAANKGYEKVVAMTKENVEAAVKAGSTAFKGYEDVIAFNKENVDAFVRASTILAKGWQDASKSFFSMSQESFEESVQVSKAMLSAKSLKEVVDMQSSIAKTSFDKIVAESGRLSETSFKLAEKALEPINERVTVAVSKIMKPIAA
jgi:phasin family protein